LTKEVIIEVEGLAASFGEREVLKDVSFKAYRGEVTVILGGSGSGKTTILKHLIGLYNVQKGSVRVLGKEIEHLTEKEQLEFYLRIGVFYQNGALLNSMSVGENVGLPLQQHSQLSREMIEKLVKLKLSLVNLGDAYSLFPSQLSGGMLKRAGLARAIAMDPPLLFCDEPGAGLDPVSLSTLDDLLLNLKKQLGISIILVTHEVSSILRVADRIIFLENGEVLFEGLIDEAFESDIQSIKRFFQKGKGEINNS
jgi:phospholipid/cholesterol/gamma-HCH transport system ATP-binding protein